jgi:hypothetical protein
MCVEDNEMSGSNAGNAKEEARRKQVRYVARMILYVPQQAGVSPPRKMCGESKLQQ